VAGGALAGGRCAAAAVAGDVPEAEGVVVGAAEQLSRPSAAHHLSHKVLVPYNHGRHNKQCNHFSDLKNISKLDLR
jgi:hypothetical protein